MIVNGEFGRNQWWTNESLEGLKKIMRIY